MDARSDLFSHNGRPPEFLPEKIRLPNGLTRYPCSITQEELESCGYVGPILIPYCSEDEYLEWDSQTNTLCVCPKSSQMFCCDEDFEVRRELKSVLSSNDIPYRESLTLEGRNKYDLFYGQIQNLLASDCLLTFNDIPTLEISCFEFEETRQDYVSSSGYLDTSNWREEYEVNGILVPKEIAAIDGYENDVMYDFLNNFIPPSDWVPSGYVPSG